MIDSETEKQNPDAKSSKQSKEIKKTVKTTDKIATPSGRPKRVIRRPNKEATMTPIRRSIRRKEKEKRKEEEKKKEQLKKKKEEERKKGKLQRGNSKESQNL